MASYGPVEQTSPGTFFDLDRRFCCATLCVLQTVAGDFLHDAATDEQPVSTRGQNRHSCYVSDTSGSERSVSSATGF